MAHLNDQPHVDAHLRYEPSGIDSNINIIYITLVNQVKVEFRVTFKILHALHSYSI